MEVHINWNYVNSPACNFPAGGRTGFEIWNHLIGARQQASRYHSILHDNQLESDRIWLFWLVAVRELLELSGKLDNNLFSATASPRIAELTSSSSAIHVIQTNIITSSNKDNSLMDCEDLHFMLKN